MNLQSSLPIPAQNSPLVDFWNEVLAPKLIKYRHILVKGSARHSAAVLSSLGVRQGDRVLDVGCGFGDTAVEFSDMVGPSGDVLGVDCCQAFIDYSWHYAEHLHASPVRFACADVEQGLSDTGFDFAFARFGTMFFANPVAGLRSIRNALRPDGQFAHIVWRNREDNPWLNEPGKVVKAILPPLGEDAQTCGPGPFSMANPDVTGAQMRAAGFADVSFKRIDGKILVGRTIEEAIAFQLAIGPAGEAFREAGEIAQARRDEVIAALTDLFSHVDTDDDGLWMDSSSWLITARNPNET